MMRKNKILTPVLLLGLSVTLLLLSAVGSTKAALTYYSENYGMEVRVAGIGVTLLENGEAVDTGNAEPASSEGGGQLLEHLTEATNGKLLPGYSYQEELSVHNSGEIDSYVRVTLYKSWQEESGEDWVKDTRLSPELIDLRLSEGSGWVVDESASTPERMVLYYTRILPAGAQTPALSDSLRIRPEILREVEQEITGGPGSETIKASYRYDDCWLSLEAEVDAVQTHNAQEAIRSAWGVDVTVLDDGSIGL